MRCGHKTLIPNEDVYLRGSKISAAVATVRTSKTPKRNNAVMPASHNHCKNEEKPGSTDGKLQHVDLGAGSCCTQRP